MQKNLQITHCSKSNCITSNRRAQYFEIRDSRIILGINSLFYATCLLPLFVSACHILVFTVADDVLRAANVSYVANSTFKLFVYFALSTDFR